MYYWFIFHNGNLLIEEQENGSYNIPFSSTTPIKQEYINSKIVVKNTFCKNDIYALDVSFPENIEPTYKWLGLRASHNELSKEYYNLAGKCFELLHWHKNNHYCSRCGTELIWNSDISKVCLHCKSEVWPQLAIAIIVLIHNKDKVLLVHAKNFRENLYGLVAGFVETGESLEEAVIREIKEETGLEVTNIQYQSSQPWPYPSNLMAGFMAEYKSGDISLQESELSAGAWFKYNELPLIPDKASLARKLIDNWLKQFKQQL